MKRKAGFTLIELLVVIAIIALLVSMLLPTLAKAKELAKKAVCASQLGGFGRDMAVYVADYGGYPHFGPQQLRAINPATGAPLGPLQWGYAYPKFCGVLLTRGIKGSLPTNFGGYLYMWQPDEVWDGAMCPAMDWVSIWQWAKARGTFTKPWITRCALGYSWNFTLRASNPRYSPGRWPNLLQGAPECFSNDFTQWIDWVINLPDGSAYGTQAVNPEEVRDPQSVAEAWDSADLDTAPNLDHGSWVVENLLPGGDVGPLLAGTNGWAVLSGTRHPGGPNILYADGHLNSDATRPIRPSDLGSCPSGSWQGIRAVSWDDYHETFGTVWHILPRLEFE